MLDYLVCFVSPYQGGGARFYVHGPRGDHVYERPEAIPVADKRFVTFDHASLVRHLGEQAKTLDCNVLDVSVLARLARGVPKRRTARRDEAPWSFWRLASEFGAADPAALETCRQVYFGARREHSSELLDGAMLELLRALTKVGEGLVLELKDKGEWRRFVDVEEPVSRICFDRSVLGVRLNSDGLSKKVADLNSRLYRSRNLLQLRYGIVSTTSQTSVKRAIEESSHPQLALHVGADDFAEIVKSYSDEDDLFALLHEERRCELDMRVLIRLVGLPTQAFYPVFETMGTVTGRIQVSDPLVQSLSRKHRDIVAAAPGMVLVYVDYDQFEARIVADEAGDARLIADVNRGRFYAALGERILSGLERGYCKRLFFKYAYGARDQSWGLFLGEIGGASRNLSDAIERVFGAYTGLDAMRRTLESELLSEGRLGSRLGNYRYLRKGESGSSDVPSWTVSQRIQGTASLILKRAILQAVDLPDVEFLLPMHDAALFQVPVRRQEELAGLLKSTFERVQSEECESVKPSASIQSFSASV